MKNLLLLALLLPSIAFAQNNSFTLLGGLNYNIVSVSSDYGPTSTFKILPGLGGQLGLNYSIGISEKIKINGLLEVQQRNNFMKNGIVLTDITGSIIGTSNPSIKNSVLCPSALIGLAPGKSFEVGTGLSVPVLLYSYSKISEGVPTYSGELKRYRNHYFKTTSLNINLYCQINLSEKISLKASYYRGITSRTIVGKEYDNLIVVTTGIRLKGN